MGVGERSEALPNIKAMGEKMLCPPREPGLRPPRTPAHPPNRQPFPSAQPNFNKSSSPQLPSEAGAALSGAAAGTQTAGARGAGPGVSPPWPSPPPSPSLFGTLIPFWALRSKERRALGKEERMEPTGGKARGQNLQKLRDVRGFWFVSLVKNYGFLMFPLFRPRGTENNYVYSMCERREKPLKKGK